MLVFESESMIRIMDMVARVAPTDSTVLITGESGTGKGLVARKLHQLSQRSRRPFITVDCGTLVETLFESELFGHVKGSFTGADANKIGKFELAQNGTLFFDEISNIGLEVQAKLLRAVEERKISKVGSHRVITVDVRIIAATNKDLTKAIKDGTFREDLFYRLNVVLIQMPPLRERKSDIPLLVQHFLEKYNARLRRDIHGISPDALDLLVRHDWPGNVRELEKYHGAPSGLESRPLSGARGPGLCRHHPDPRRRSRGRHFSQGPGAQSHHPDLAALRRPQERNRPGPGHRLQDPPGKS